MSIADHDISLIRTLSGPGVWKIAIDGVTYDEYIGPSDDVIAKIKNLVYKIETTAKIRSDLDAGIY